MEKEELIKLCKLNDEELKKFWEFIENKDPKKDHHNAYRTLMNQHRRNILKTIGYNAKTTEELINELNIDRNQVEYHLTMLEQLYCIMKSDEGWKATPRGIGFLKNSPNMF